MMIRSLINWAMGTITLFYLSVGAGKITLNDPSLGTPYPLNTEQLPQGIRALKKVSYFPVLLLCCLSFFLTSCGDDALSKTASSSLQEIKLTGQIVEGKAQLSGLAWLDDWLILLPQYPDFAGDGSFVYGLPKQMILDYLAADNKTAVPLTPIPIPFHTNNLNIFGSQGFEAVAFGQLETAVSTSPRQAVFTIEAAPWGQMRGYLLRGEMALDHSSLSLDSGTVVEMLPQARQFNMAYEAVLIANEHIFAFYELNGARFNGQPVALRFGHDLTAAGTAVMPHIPYRITDVTNVDENGRFWAINYLPPGLNLLTPQPTLRSRQPAIEQLIELQIVGNNIRRTKTPPLNLIGEEGRNWEGIVRLDNQGFLLATDNHPRTMLTFIVSSNSHHRQGH